MSDDLTERAIAEANAVFDKDVGTWDAEMEIRPAPDAPVIRVTGVSHNRRIADGRWLVVDYKASSGFEGHGIYGWDPARDAYVGVWADSTHSALAHATGTWDAASKTMTFESEARIGDRTIRYREVTQTLDDGSLLYRNVVPLSDGKEFDLIRGIYRRRA